jgi:hypothetical protein
MRDLDEVFAALGRSPFRQRQALDDNDGRYLQQRGLDTATATCCRGCLAKWHAIEPGRPLSDAERDYVVQVIGRWLQKYLQPADP